jgi:hypothetical protein
MIRLMGLPPKTLANVLAGGAKRYYNIHKNRASVAPRPVCFMLTGAGPADLRTALTYSVRPVSIV